LFLTILKYIRVGKVTTINNISFFLFIFEQNIFKYLKNKKKLAQFFIFYYFLHKLLHFICIYMHACIYTYTYIHVWTCICEYLYYINSPPYEWHYFFYINSRILLIFNHCIIFAICKKLKGLENKVQIKRRFKQNLLPLKLKSSNLFSSFNTFFSSTTSINIPWLNFLC
jgi:hypothetical protein